MREREKITMKNFAETVYTTVYETNEKGELKQNVRNQFKADLMSAFKDFLKEQGFDAETVSDGVAVSFANETEGSICVVFDGTVKSLSYDLDSEMKAHAEKVAEKAEKAEKAAKAKAEKIALAEKAKAEKAKGKETK